MPEDRDPIVVGYEAWAQLYECLGHLMDRIDDLEQELHDLKLLLQVKERGKQNAKNDLGLG